MSDVKKCDRCGAVYEPGASSRVLFEYNSSGVGRTRNGGDMCPTCSRRFARWWGKKRKEGSK